MHKKDIFDVIIIGGGPTGMFAAFYAGLRELKTKVIETLPVLGGQVEIMYPEKMIFDIGAYPYIKGGELIHQLEKQMEPFDTEIRLNESVLTLHKLEDEKMFEVRTNKQTHYARAILVTTGLGSFEARKLTFDYPEAYEQTNLHYYVSKLETYRDKVVAITGGGDSAVDWALTLEGIAKKVYIIHRRDKFRAHEASVTRLKNSSVEVITPYVPIELIGDGKEIKEVVFQKRRDKETFVLPVDYFIVSFGFVSDNRQLDEWGLSTEHSNILVTQKMETNIPGIYAAGDVTTFDGKVKLIATGFGEAPTAVNAIIQYLNPGKTIQAPTTGAEYNFTHYETEADSDSHTDIS